MPDITIPDAAVEAAARNMFDLRVTEPDQSPTEWDELPEPWQDEWRDGARAAIEAAAPYIAAQALRERRRGNEVWRKCSGCRRNIHRSEPCWYDRETDTARCSECGPHHREEEVPHGVA